MLGMPDLRRQSHPISTPSAYTFSVLKRDCRMPQDRPIPICIIAHQVPTNLHIFTFQSITSRTAYVYVCVCVCLFYRQLAHII